MGPTQGMNELVDRMGSKRAVLQKMRADLETIYRRLRSESKISWAISMGRRSLHT